MTDRLIVACAGGGKSTLISNKALEPSADNRRVLLLTYTESNQQELLAKLCDSHGSKPSNVRIKGWFRFLLEDLIRPYQSCIFSRRLNNIMFNENNPHKRNGRNIPGTGAQINGAMNAKHYLTSTRDRAHTMFLSKLAVNIDSATNGSVAGRIGDIYRLVLIDEIQDLVGWDYEVIKLLRRASIDLVCVGDFRQTIYETAYTQKAPETASQKLSFFRDGGFELTPRNLNYRSIQPICNVSDTIHSEVSDYPRTLSRARPVPFEVADHLGVYTVSEDNVQAYLEKYQPVILRSTRSSRNDICQGRRAINFGKSKGMSFDRTLVVTTENQRKFLAGNRKAFDSGKTDTARNLFYVALTRSRYSVALLTNDLPAIDGVSVWEP